MKPGFLNDFFEGVATKRLAPVEVNSMVSNQHEFNVNSLVLDLFGRPAERQNYSAQYFYFDDNESASCGGLLTLYDARKRDPKRSEYRMYFSRRTSEIMGRAESGDSLCLCKKRDGSVLVIVAKQFSNMESQLYYLFNLRPVSGRRFEGRIGFLDLGQKIEIVVREILSVLGIEYKEPGEDEWLARMISEFGGAFPSTADFSEFARSTVATDPIDAPDETLMLWYDRETVLFKILERHVIGERLKRGFCDKGGVDIDGFIRYSLSVQNRRKSRAGHALENSISELLSKNRITFTRTPLTENRNRPDFLFPSIEAYRDRGFPDAGLTMLGAKTSTKDRWRQVLEEADRIPHKHLITLEAPISTNMTDQMRSRRLQLVVPKQMHSAFTQEQQAWLFTVSDFLELVSERQKQYMK